MAAREAYSPYVERAVEGAVPPQMGPYPRSSLDYSRTMKEKGHRTSPRCYRCGVETYLDAHTRRLDGYSLYTANHVRIRVQRQADCRGVRPGACQFGRRSGPA